MSRGGSEALRRRREKPAELEARVPFEQLPPDHLIPKVRRLASGSLDLTPLGLPALPYEVHLGGAIDQPSILISTELGLARLPIAELLLGVVEANAPSDPPDDPLGS